MGQAATAILTGTSRTSAVPAKVKDKDEDPKAGRLKKQSYVPDILVNDEHKIVKLVKQHDGRDKIAKFLIAITDIVNAILDTVSTVSKSIKDGFISVGKALRLYRAIGGLMNVFNGAIPQFIAAAKETAALVKSIIYGTDYKEDKYPGKAGKAVGLVEQVATLGEKSNFIVAFGACTPCLFVKDNFPESVSEGAKDVGKKFNLVWMMFHMFGFVKNVAKLLREWLILKANQSDEAIAKFMASAKKLSLAITEKTFEVGANVITYFKLGAPKEVVLAFNMISASVGLFKLYHEEK